jgi:hypothetical protein
MPRSLLLHQSAGGGCAFCSERHLVASNHKQEFGVCRNMNRSTDRRRRETPFVPRKLVVENSASPTTRHLQIGETRWRGVRLRGLDRLGLGAWGACLFPSGTVHEVSLRQARHRRGEAGRKWQRQHHQHSGHRYQASPIPRLPSLAAEIGIAGHRKVSTRGLSLDDENIGTSISTTRGARREAEISSIQPTPAGPATQQSVREGSHDSLDAQWPFAVTAFTRSPSSKAGADAKAVKTHRRGHSEPKTDRNRSHSSTPAVCSSSPISGPPTPDPAPALSAALLHSSTPDESVAIAPVPIAVARPVRPLRARARPL